MPGIRGSRVIALKRYASLMTLNILGSANQAVYIFMTMAKEFCRRTSKEEFTVMTLNILLARTLPACVDTGGSVVANIQHYA